MGVAMKTADLGPKERVLASQQLRQIERSRVWALIRKGRIDEVDQGDPTVEYMRHNPAAKKVQGRDPEGGAIVYHLVTNQDTEIGRQMAKGVINGEQMIAGSRFATDYHRCACGPDYATTCLERRGKTHQAWVKPTEVDFRYEGARRLFMGAALSLQINVLGRDMSVNQWCQMWNRELKVGQRRHRWEDGIELLRAVCDDLKDFYGVKARRR